jgi:hypothetical protein
MMRARMRLINLRVGDYKQLQNRNENILIGSI